MTTRKAVWIQCDGAACGSQVPLDLSCTSRFAAEQLAKSQGWKLRVRISVPGTPSAQKPEYWDLCPNCIEFPFNAD